MSVIYEESMGIFSESVGAPSGLRGLLDLLLQPKLHLPRTFQQILSQRRR